MLYPILILLLGIAVWLFGHRLAILGAAVGGLLGVVVLQLLLPNAELVTQLLVVLGLAVVGFFLAAFARGIIEVVILVIGAFAGAAAALALLNAFGVERGVLNWVLAVVGGAVGLALIRRSRHGRLDWGMVVLSTLVGSLLIMRALMLMVPALRETFWPGLLLVMLLVVGFAYQGGFLMRRRRPIPIMPSAPPPTDMAEETLPASTLPGPRTPPPMAADVLPPMPIPPPADPADTEP